MAFQRTRLSRAISNAVCTSTTLTTALALVPATSAAAAQTDEPARRAIEEVVVTATRRSENMQDVPISIHAFDQQTIRDLRIGKFEDYVGATPGVSLAGQGPGRNEVFIRGVSAGRGGVRIAGIGQEPNVAIYIDDAPITTPGRNVDVYTTDLERIEVLKGPQGTQFGASSQTGTIRLITNKPVLNEFQFGGEFGLSSLKNGETGNVTEGYVNLPVIDDRLALRFAGYDVKKAGFIDNISGTKKFPLENPTMAARIAAGNPPPERRTEITNLNVAEDDFNTEELRGLRSSVYYEHNENWDFHAQFLHQQQDTEGIWEVQPELRSPGGAEFSTQTLPPGEVGEFTTQTFSVDSGDDKLNHGTWTLNGRIDTGRLAGLDLFIPRKHYLDPEQVDRAMTATIGAIELAADLGRVPVSLTLPIKRLPADLASAMVESADAHSVRLAVHAEHEPTALSDWIESVDLPALGAAIDPATLLAQSADPSRWVQRFGQRMVVARVSDLERGVGDEMEDSEGAHAVDSVRCAVGQGELDVLAYRVSLDLATGRAGPVVLDLRGLTSPMHAAQSAKRAWDDAAVSF